MGIDNIEIDKENEMRICSEIYDSEWQELEVDI